MRRHNHWFLARWFVGGDMRKKQYVDVDFMWVFILLVLTNYCYEQQRKFAHLVDINVLADVNQIQDGFATQIRE